ncbi:hypothetical protein GH714_008203 [Hevea brasiliensis]|uniref:Uncharacterized protein n=1 Tax=Hevea brasiliensis TaxID=3981 RepID=A0A6A6N1Z6_HEVBR|nr:hypothetical protein GH714_008203 [Hevea brasiliensis]
MCEKMEKLTFCCVLLLSFGAIFLDDLDDRFPLPISTWTFPSVHAEKLIRKLNLFPEKDVNIVRDGDASLLDGRKRIVEKRFRFPNVVDDEYGEVSVKDLGHHAGYYKIANSHAARMFYFFFESRNSRKDPVVIWLTGGPGCSSELGMFYEKDPFTIADNMSLAWNPYGWDQASNILYVEQPIGTGFSYSSDIRDIPHNEQGVSNDLYDFLQGFAIGNGLTDPAIQHGAYHDYALDMGLIKKSDYDLFNKVLPVCEMGIKLCGNLINFSYLPLENPWPASFCQAQMAQSHAWPLILFAAKSVRDSHDVGDISFVSCGPTVHQALLMDRMRNLEPGIPALLEYGIKMLVYAGEYDLICNWLGNSRWIHAMEWSGQKDFVASPEVPFEVDGSEGGVLRSHGPFAFLKVHDAGHMVPMEQPKASLEMLKRWIQGKLSESEGTADPKELVSEM